ncbi:hypothetical protein ACT3CD_03940 [Geofilum sp. OHC36d9]|uniref:hypothetical protein n=1 Tax=Geofilum sp. OHC36d9 TaxID=3458413 RepID=UPI0040332045
MEHKIFKQIQLFFWLVFAALISFSVVTFAVAPMVSQFFNWTAQEVINFKSIIILLSLAGIPAAFVLHSKRVKRISASLPLHDRLRQYRAGFYIKIITFEALAVLSLLGYLVTFQQTFLIMSGLLGIAFLINIPVKGRILEELEPEASDEREADKDD